MNKNFIFDFDEVLFHTFPLQAAAFHHAVRYVCKHHEIEAEFPDRDTVIDILYGRSEQDAIGAFLQVMPSLSDYIGECVDEYYFAFSRFVEHSKGLGISDSLLVVKQLLALGLPVCIATHADDATVQTLLSREEGLDHYLTKVPIYGKDSMGGQWSKPDKMFYLEVARRLNVRPDRCVVFEDSPIGVRSASDAGMYVVCLDRPYAQEHQERKSLANEWVQKISQADIFTSHAITFNMPTDNSLSTSLPVELTSERIDLNTLSAEEREKALRQCYAVYNCLFLGRDEKTFYRKLYNPRAENNRLLLIQDQATIVGFSSLQLHSFSVGNSGLLYATAITGLLPNYRDKSIIFNYYHQELTQFAANYSGRKIIFIDNVLNPVIYYMMTRGFSVFCFPSPKNPVTGEHLSRMKALCHRLEITSHENMDESVHKSNSLIFIDSDQLEQWLFSTNPSMTFFREKTHLLPGFGLTVTVDISAWASL